MWSALSRNVVMVVIIATKHRASASRHGQISNPKKIWWLDVMMGVPAKFCPSPPRAENEKREWETTKRAELAPKAEIPATSTAASCWQWQSQGRASPCSGNILMKQSTKLVAIYNSADLFPLVRKCGFWLDRSHSLQLLTLYLNAPTSFHGQNHVNW